MKDSQLTRFAVSRHHQGFPVIVDTHSGKFAPFSTQYMAELCRDALNAGWKKITDYLWSA